MQFYVKNTIRMCILQAKHLLTNAFKIYSASAGSGKTYQLTKAYLKLILAPFSKQKYRELLAITFTNKAVAEMKERILESLYAFSQEKVPENKIAFFKDMLDTLNVTPLELRSKSKQVLKELLHNYAFFEVSTIDKFTHKIIRTFARDLKISQGFDVVLDTDALLEEAVGRLLNRAGEHKQLTKVLLDFSLEKIEDDKSWNITYDLFEIGKLLFQENHNYHLKAIANKGIKDFTHLQKTIKNKTKASEQTIKKYAEEILELINANQLEFTDFTRSSFPKFIKGLADGNFKVDFTTNWKQNFDSNKLYNKTCPETIKAKIDSLHPQFSILFTNIKEQVHRSSFLKNCYNNIVPLTVLNEISKEVRALQKEKDILPISEFNTIISEEIKNQPVPFIYERLGEKYRHYFIDEFQDTSQMQWQNLIPLIGNAVESENERGEKGSLLLVGDAKQAIYRWRGGRAEQFLNLLSLKTNPFVLEPKVESLDTNWRSQEEIIAFNNSFFNFAASKLNNSDYKKLFEDGNRQKTNSKNGGYVEIDFVKQDVSIENDPYCEKTLELLKRVLSNGFELKDICILVRDNKKGTLLADFLTKQDIPVISPDSLLLANNSEVSFLVSLLQFIENFENKEAVYAMLVYLFKEEGNEHDFIIQHLLSFKSLLKEAYGFDVELAKALSTYNLLELAITHFQLAGNSDAHLTQFMDEVFNFSQKEDSSIFSFLHFWNRKKAKLSVKAPESLNAVQIMTVHKAKGLEFPVVIFPYADAKIIDHRSKKLWLPVDAATYEGFNELLINSNKDLVNYGDAAAKIYNDELQKSELDSFNVLYVALTRAKNALFIVSSEENTGNTYAELFIDYLKELHLWNSERLSYSFGDFLENKITSYIQDEEQSIPYIYSQKSNSNFSIVTKANMLWDMDRLEAIQTGNLIHKALSKVFFYNDIETAITTLITDGDVTASNADQLKEILNQVVFHPQLSSYFEDNLTVYNEIELLTPEGQLLRPDRLIVKEKEVSIIDYKTGSVSETHKNQLLEYASVLERMDLIVKDMILVYINETVKPIFI